MRKKIKIKGAVKIMSCVNGKIVRYAFIALCVCALNSCATTHHEPSDSWNTYCEKHHVNPSNPTKEQENYYLDCYVGSVEEENDLRRYVVMPFSSTMVQEVLMDDTPKDYSYIVYCDSTLNLDHELLKVDMETANMLIASMNSKCGGKLTGYLVYNAKTGMYNYNHELR